MFDSIITLLVGGAIFLTGMEMMSNGLKKASGPSLKRLWQKIGDNKILGMLIGASVTALVQSSSATSVMTLGFLNANVMTLMQGISIVLGAYLGTTVTGVLVSLSSFSVSSYLMLFTLVGVVLQVLKKEKTKNIGKILAGLGILFVGLETMSGAFENENILNFFRELFQKINIPVVLVLLGCLFTALVQSSSATSGIVIVMAGKGALSLLSGCYIMIGATVGTVITTLLATMSGNANSKRLCFLAFLDRVLAAIFGTIILVLTGNIIPDFFSRLFANNTELALAFFLIAYNVIFLLLAYPFLKTAVNFANRIIKDKDEDELKNAIMYIDDNLLMSSSLALMQVKKEIVHMFELSIENHKLAYDKLFNRNHENDESIEKNEEKIDYINGRISDFLIKLSSNATPTQSRVIGTYFHVINDIERIGDHAYNFFEMGNRLESNSLAFSEIAHSEFDKVEEVLSQMFDLSYKIFQKNLSKELIQLHNLEEKTDQLKEDLSTAHYDRLVKQMCKVELSPYYTSVVTGLERIADHLVNIGYSIVSPIGEDNNEVK